MFRVGKTTRKTRRAASPFHPANPIVDLSGSPVTPLVVSEPTFTKSIDSIFAAETEAATNTKPWLRLERGLRLQKFRGYATNYPGLNAEEQESLYKILVKANDAKLLNTKQQITYENGVIQAIKGLKVIRSGDLTQPATFKIELPRGTVKNQG